MQNLARLIFRQLSAVFFYTSNRECAQLVVNFSLETLNWRFAALRTGLRQSGSSQLLPYPRTYVRGYGSTVPSGLGYGDFENIVTPEHSTPRRRDILEW